MNNFFNPEQYKVGQFETLNDVRSIYANMDIIGKQIELINESNASSLNNGSDITLGILKFFGLYNSCFAKLISLTTDSSSTTFIDMYSANYYSGLLDLLQNYNNVVFKYVNGQNLEKYIQEHTRLTTELMDLRSRISSEYK